tara:strand:- start:4481 stop:5215 length:735 start_codon:yes stop_codon:yes gene_type:complete
MDKKSAKKILLEHQEALRTLLESQGLGDVKADLKEIKETTEEGRKALKKSLVERIKDLPVVQKVSELGTAGTVAVATAGTAQVGIATDLTTVFVAEIAEDVVEERFEVPMFIDNFVDFHSLNAWGQVVIAEKVAEIQELSSPSEVSEPQPTPTDTPASEDTTQESSSSSQDSPDDKPSQSKPTESSQESKAEKSETTENKSSSDEPKESPTEVKNELPIVETPFEQMGDDIKPHSSIRLVSPTS